MSATYDSCAGYIKGIFIFMLFITKYLLKIKLVISITNTLSDILTLGDK